MAAQEPVVVRGVEQVEQAAVRRVAEPAVVQAVRGVEQAVAREPAQELAVVPRVRRVPLLEPQHQPFQALRLLQRRQQPPQGQPGRPQ